MPFFLISLCFKVYFVCYKYSYPNFLWASICMEYIFPSLHFQSISLLTFAVSLLQAAYWWVLFFFIYSATLCLPNREFSQFTFKVINKYVLTVILLIVFWLFCSSSLFLSSSLAHFHYGLMTFSSGMLRLLSCYLLCTYYRFLLCSYHIFI